MALGKVYDPHATEERWYRYWLDGGFFHAEVDKNKEPFCIVIPPPNVTGQLHLGHALDNTLQDILIRWQRMSGKNAVWIPGTDHAGIATQIKVEEELAREGKTRYDIGREAFLERVWQWKEHYGNRIIDQLKDLGASCDWERQRFTMDDGCSRAVREVFVRLYEKGLIYQGYYIINWCPRCQTALSDIEVEHQDQAGKLWQIRYPLTDGSGELVVATTRPETMLGDTAVAVHPEDPRYSELVGKELELPLVGRRIPIIADEYVDPSFGTGAVKVTPAHDPNDFAMGERHELQQIVVIDTEGKMNEHAGPYLGLDRFECREKLVADLDAAGFLVGIEEHQHAVGSCSRCNTTVEPYLSKQWFVKMKPLAEPAIEAVREGRVEFIPSRFSKLYLSWVENVRDWCISRQLWWGHRIPVWYCQDCHEVIVTREDPTQCTACGSQNLEQDPDVLDTWFSSALWPFSTLGWPQETPELAHFYPTSVLVTGFDIIYFWVARMVFMGLEFMGEVPFHKVYIHGLLRDGQGRKMSKSLGNGIDPSEVIAQYGADTLRFSLVTGTAPGNDMRFYSEKIEGARNFANKIWNAARFALMNLEDFQPQSDEWEHLPLELADRWIRSRYRKALTELEGWLERFELGEAARVLHDFIWNELCDWYLELAKPRLYGRQGEEPRRSAQYTLWYVLARTMELLHPFMPYITEEIWQQLPHDGPSIMVAPWPTPPEEFADDEAEAQMELVMDAIRAIRNVRSEKQVPPGRKIVALVQGELDVRELFAKYSSYLKELAGLEELKLQERASAPDGAITAAVARDYTIYLPLAGLVDLRQERERLDKEMAGAKQQLERVRGKLGNPGFVGKAPAAVVERERTREKELEALIVQLEARLEELEV